MTEEFIGCIEEELKVFLIMGFRMNPDEAGILSFFAGAFFAYIGNRGVRAMFKLRELSK